VVVWCWSSRAACSSLQREAPLGFLLHSTGQTSPSLASWVRCHEGQSLGLGATPYAPYRCSQYHNIAMFLIVENSSTTRSLGPNCAAIFCHSMVVMNNVWWQVVTGQTPCSPSVRSLACCLRVSVIDPSMRTEEEARSSAVTFRSLSFSRFLLRNDGNHAR